MDQTFSILPASSFSVSPCVLHRARERAILTSYSILWPSVYLSAFAPPLPTSSVSAMEPSPLSVEAAADIFESSLTLETTHCEEGYADGYRDGAVSGKRDGYEVGLKHGFEVGEELGFYKGLVDVWLSAIRVDPSCFSTRVQKSIHQMSDLLENYPIQDPESEGVDEMKTSLRLKFRAICASLGLKLEYGGYPKTSDPVDIGF